MKSDQMAQITRLANRLTEAKLKIVDALVRDLAGGQSDNLQADYFAWSCDARVTSLIELANMMDQDTIDQVLFFAETSVPVRESGSTN